ncbi:MAG: hypothetical protein GY859_42270, partial [Desulfobacterales bacterium]|nr:hypothetical protein [Desulfobacterales bacterium]
MLTILALVKRQFNVLPELRAQLYDVALKTLVGAWNRTRSLGGAIEGVDMPVERTIRAWEPVALWMHRTHPAGAAPRAEIIEKISDSLQQDGVDSKEAVMTAESYLDSATRWAGLLLEKGPNVFGFMHQTFQEYLAARALVRDESDHYEILKNYLFRPRWREVILLAAGYLSAVQERIEASSKLIRTILKKNDADDLESVLHRHLYLAATILGDRAPVRKRV